MYLSLGLNFLIIEILFLVFAPRYMMREDDPARTGVQDGPGSGVAFSFPDYILISSQVWFLYTTECQWRALATLFEQLD